MPVFPAIHINFRGFVSHAFHQATGQRLHLLLTQRAYQAKGQRAEIVNIAIIVRQREQKIRPRESVVEFIQLGQRCFMNIDGYDVARDITTAHNSPRCYPESFLSIVDKPYLATSPSTGRGSTFSFSPGNRQFSEYPQANTDGFPD